ncbi:MAG: glycosyltransferase family 39 protein [Desulfobacterales bacterium]
MAQDYSLGQILSPMTDILYNDVHPPLFYVICKLWRIVGYDAFHHLTGDMEFAFRLPFAVISAAVAPILYGAGKRLSGARLGWTLGILHVVNSYSIQMVHQSRMYPLVELLAAVSVAGWLTFRNQRDGPSIWVLAACSSLMMLTHYLCVFYLIVLWALVGFAGRRRPLRVLGALFLAALGFLWWSPALLHQLQAESSAAGPAGSTGLIIPYTLWQFLLGDRSLAFGAMTLSILNFWTAAVFSIVVFWTVFIAWRERSRLAVAAGIGFLGIGSIGLLWSGTFLIPRVFNATYYAIFALPAVLVAAGAILSVDGGRFGQFGWVILILMVVTNAATLTFFYRDMLFPYEPWKEACRQLRSRQVDRVAVYSPHMALLIRLYGADLRPEPLPNECGKWSPQPGVCDAERSTALVISHDRGQGACYAERFRECFGPYREHLALHGIDITIFGRGP